MVKYHSSYLELLNCLRELTLQKKCQECYRTIQYICIYFLLRNNNSICYIIVKQTFRSTKFILSSLRNNSSASFIYRT